MRALRSRRSVILCYHGVGPSSAERDPHFLRVAPPRFRAHIELLRDAGFDFVTVAELVRRADGGDPPPGLVAISFDDGMDDNHAIVLPILHEYGLPATVYVATGFIGKPNPWIAPDSGARMMTAPELRDLVEAGFELGAHSVTHPDLSQLDFDQCLREMIESRETIERLTGVEVQTFAYPFCVYGAEARAAAEQAGFLAAVTCHGRGSWAPFEMKRAMITGKDGLPSFFLKLVDAYEPLFESLPGRIARTSSRGARRAARRLLERRAASRAIG